MYRSHSCKEVLHDCHLKHWRVQRQAYKPLKALFWALAQQTLLCLSEIKLSLLTKSLDKTMCVCALALCFIPDNKRCAVNQMYRQHWDLNWAFAILLRVIEMRQDPKPSTFWPKVFALKEISSEVAVDPLYTLYGGRPNWNAKYQ